MVATPDIAFRIERALNTISGETEYLWELDGQWESMPDWEQVDFSLQWDHLMASYLAEVDEFYWDGELSGEQQARYLQLLDRLKEAYPVIERLNLYRPPVVLEI